MIQTMLQLRLVLEPSPGAMASSRVLSTLLLRERRLVCSRCLEAAIECRVFSWCTWSFALHTEEVGDDDILEKEDERRNVTRPVRAAGLCVVYSCLSESSVSLSPGSTRFDDLPVSINVVHTCRH